MLIRGDAAHIPLRDCSVHAVVTDPPAGIGFMGKAWDGDKGGRDQWIAWLTGVMQECRRVLKPGGHALVWALPRTSHWTATAVEDAGFEVRDVVTHLFGTGFPKSLDVSKAIDKAAGAERVTTGQLGSTRCEYLERGEPCVGHGDAGKSQSGATVHTAPTAPATDAARQWSGWGTALKPAAEFWVLARKPLVGTVAANVLEHGCGALNVDGCRIKTEGEAPLRAPQSDPNNRQGVVGVSMQARSDAERNQAAQRESIERTNSLGRWPANVTLDEEAAAMLDEKSAPGMHSAGAARERGLSRQSEHYSASSYELPKSNNSCRFGDSGGASRFFYVAKPSTAERGGENNHPTVKSQALMKWLIKLITPPGGIVLDPFCGSGSTIRAARDLGHEAIGMDLEPQYLKIADKRKCTTMGFGF